MLGSLLRHLLAAGLVATAIGGCAADDLLGTDSSEIEGQRTWKLSPEAAAAGKVVRIAYDAAPVWRGTATCSGSLRAGTRTLGKFLSDRYAAIDTVGGYACRRNTADSSRMSVHGTGRALDLMISPRGGVADSARGDVIANWLVMNAQRIGVQLIIWNHTIWRANGTNTARYGGPIPHIDHIHVEITNVAASAGTPWFDTMDEGELDASADAARMADGAVDDDDDVDASTAEPAIDAGAPETDAAAKDSGAIAVDASPPPPPATDAGEAPDPDVDPDEPELQGQPGSLPPEEADPGGSADGYDYEVPEGESAPDDALSSKSKRGASSAADDGETLESKGCSAAPARTTTTANARFAMLGILGLALAISRRSKKPS